MPELAAVYAVGFLACFALTLLYVFLRERRRHSHGAQCVQDNLAKLNLYWSDSADGIVPLSATSASDEAKKSQKTIGYMGLILSLLSWAGFFFLLLIMISERFLARSRRERHLFGSVLSHQANMDANEVRRIISDLDVMNDSPLRLLVPSERPCSVF